jgi:hypothetical protein
MQNIINHAMLKFRIPFFIEEIPYNVQQDDFDLAKELGCDFVEGTKDNISMPYLKGISYLQAWDGGKSTEQRLVISGEDIKANNLVIWNAKMFEDACFYYNCIDRYLLHENDFACPEIGFDHCNDCSIESHIWQTYKQKFAGKNFDILAKVKLVSKILNVPLLNRHEKIGHGLLFPNTDLTKLQ